MGMAATSGGSVGSAGTAGVGSKVASGADEANSSISEASSGVSLEPLLLRLSTLATMFSTSSGETSCAITFSWNRSKCRATASRPGTSSIISTSRLRIVSSDSLRSSLLVSRTIA